MSGVSISENSGISRDASWALTCRCRHHYISSAEGAMCLFASLNLNDASNAKYMLAVKPHRAIGHRKADWAEVVVDLWYN